MTVGLHVSVRGLRLQLLAQPAGEVLDELPGDAAGAGAAGLATIRWPRRAARASEMASPKARQ